MHTMNAARVKAAFEWESILLDREDLVRKESEAARYNAQYSKVVIPTVPLKPSLCASDPL